MQASSARSGQRHGQREPGPGVLARARDGVADSASKYGDYVFGQAAMREVERRFGLEAITFDEFLENPQRSRRRMSHWLRGAGGVVPQPRPPTA